ncbi:WD repeat-containing protein 75-like [Schistocerca gregaria]|uniref:WD repeat-containing protein 75-like n=1 Tax=Schistocerca gregaria TaxID=7010 RepID=UPI00211E0670|nr:WD repeat-containing protein 75-like [Schistocerca gregaria]
MPSRLDELHVGGGKIASLPIVFTNDSKYFFCACGSTVKMFSTTTGEQTRVLNGHDAVVIGMAINPGNPLQLYSFGKDQKICLWDYNDAIILSTFFTGLSVEHFAFNPKFNDVVYLSSVGPREGKPKSETYSIYSFHLGDGGQMERTKQGKKSLDLITQVKARKRSKFLVTPNGDYLVIQAKYHWKLFDLETKQTFKYPHRNAISCCTIHPKQHFVATGDDHGEITFWYVFSEHSNTVVLTNKSKTVSGRNGGNSAPLSVQADPITTSMHWHPHRVCAIDFDSSGTYLYSGGYEMVLVVWQLESGRRDFLPRLGAPIHCIAHTPDESLLALCFGDNTIKLINSRSFFLQVKIEGIGLSAPLELFPLRSFRQSSHPASLLRLLWRLQKIPTGLIVDPIYHSLVFAATDGQIQFYSAQEDRSVAKIQIGHKTQVKYFQDYQILSPSVTHIAFSKSGSWMVTANVRDSYTSSTSLKFWHWNPRSCRYELRTACSLREGEGVNSLAYHPSEEVCAVASKDGKFKVWKVKVDESKKKTFSPFSNQTSKKKADPNPKHECFVWYVASIGVYKGMVPTLLTFSRDGSLLAVAYQHIITIWDSSLNTCIKVLAYPPPFEHISSMEFVPATSYLVACSKCTLYVWDLLTCRIHWGHRMSAEMLAVDPKSTRFALYVPTPYHHLRKVVSEGDRLDHVSDGCIFIFDVSDPAPIGYWVLPGLGVRGIAFLPPHPSSPAAQTPDETVSSLVYLNGDNELKFLLQNYQRRESDASKTLKTHALSSLEQQQQFLEKLNSTKLVEGPSVFKLMYGGEDNNLISSAIDAEVDHVPAPCNRAIASIPAVTSKAKTPEIPLLDAAPQRAVKLTEKLLQGLESVESNALPPPTTFYPEFIDALILRSDQTPAKREQAKTSPQLSNEDEPVNIPHIHHPSSDFLEKELRQLSLNHTYPFLQNFFAHRFGKSAERVHMDATSPQRPVQEETQNTGCASPAGQYTLADVSKAFSGANRSKKIKKT